MQSEPGDPPRRARLTVVLGLNQLLSWATSFYLPAVVADAAARDFGMSAAATLGAFTWSLLVAGLCAPRVGRWIDRHGGRMPLAGSAVVLGIGLLLMAAASGPLTWYAAWAVVGGGMALGLYDAAFATAGRALGMAAGPTITGFTLLGGFASTVGWPAGSGLLHLFSWRGALVAYAMVQLGVNLPLILIGLPATLHRVAPAARAPGTEAATPNRGTQLACMSGFFATRWFLTSAIAAHVLPLLNGVGLTAGQALLAAMLIGPGQVLGRIVEWSLASRLSPLGRAWLGALLFPAGALLLFCAGPPAVFGFAILYGMSNGILTVNRGTLPMAVFGPAKYARLLGWLAVPVLLAQAVAPTVAAPVVGAGPAQTILECAGFVAGLASLLLLPLRTAART